MSKMVYLFIAVVRRLAERRPVVAADRARRHVSSTWHFILFLD